MTTDRDRITMLQTVEVMAHKLTGEVATLRSLMLDAAAGVKGQSYDSGPKGERREVVAMPYDTGDPDRPLVQVKTSVPVPTNDPTGESAIQPDQARADLRELDKLVTRLYKTVQDLGGLHDRWTPTVGAKRPTTDTDGPGDDWCSSCWRDGKHLEPVSVRYRGVCRFCGDYRSEKGELPPMPILQARHRGERITTAMVARYTRPKGKTA